jgi:DNA ligase-1
VPRNDISLKKEISTSAFGKLEDKVTPLKLVPTYIAKNREEVMKYHQQFVAMGYEGTMVRNLHGLYKFKDRSKDLLKYKDFVDSEYEIVGGFSGAGTEKDCIVFEVKDDKGTVFAVRPRGSFEKRKVWLKEVKSLVGKKLTVRYQELTDAGIPRFPVGITVRDYE